jgi:thiol-disulfide isomerase/thioredoxin
MGALLIKLLFIFAALLAATVGLFAQNEQSPIVEKDIAYKNWTYKGVLDGEDQTLRDLTKGKKLVAVVYFAPWCPNWRHDAPLVQKLYDKYKGNGFAVVAVGEYGMTDEMNANIKEFDLTFPMVFESFSRDSRQATTHYNYRTATGDTRKWGSPYYIFLEPATLEKKGDVLLSHESVINGEMIMTDGEKFIRQKLGLSAEQPTAAATTNKNGPEVCDPAKPADLKKPTDKP